MPETPNTRHLHGDQARTKAQTCANTAQMALPSSIPCEPHIAQQNMPALLAGATTDCCTPRSGARRSPGPKGPLL
eukprot:14021173-Alexandrium_andersonii.AAC.1